jgi:hypothetical protein
MAVKVTGGRLGDEVLGEVPENTFLSLNDLLSDHYKDCCSKRHSSLEFSVVQKLEHGVNDEYIFMTEQKKFMALNRYLKVDSLENKLRGFLPKQE